ncbi:GGDEF domain-containing protein [Comamonas sp. UBA7528]|uniref:GGDEF domain-containing protein n=1 Tax=Comamonas sp. UBA7528 TaxID=1946391 RepID=UPI001B785724|nr:sensor domain-containing diguanylate cyclase [Comamonas sp. UBA7528]MBP7352327.1 diguanylate cyclase [Comamonas sp.]
MAASHTAVAPRAHWAVRMNWKNRSTSFALLGLALGSQVQVQHGAVWLWGLLVLQFLVYPHLLYVRGLYAAHPRKAEVQHMLADALCFGAWAAVLDFSLWVSFILFVGASVNLLAFRSWVGWLEALVAMAAGVLLVGLVRPLHFVPDSSMLTTVLCMATLMAFLAVFAQDSYRRATMLHQQRSQLRNKLDEIRALKDRLTEQAERDPLTGLLNRRMLEDSLPRLLESCRVRQTSLALMLLDVDFFKQTNDRHGHAAGDQLLQSLARHLQHSCRSQDMVFRYGGDEFLVLFPDTPIEVAWERAQTLRQAFAGRPRRLERHTVHATLSCGLAAFPAHANEAKALMERADDALYRAKAQGRNRVVVCAAGQPDARTACTAL